MGDAAPAASTARQWSATSNPRPSGSGQSSPAAAIERSTGFVLSTSACDGPVVTTTLSNRSLHDVGRAAGAVFDDDAVLRLGGADQTCGVIGELAARDLGVEDLLDLRRDAEAVHVPEGAEVPDQPRALARREPAPGAWPCSRTRSRVPCQLCPKAASAATAERMRLTRARAVGAGCRAKSTSLLRATTPWPRERSPWRESATNSPQKPRRQRLATTSAEVRPVPTISTRSVGPIAAIRRLS